MGFKMTEEQKEAVRVFSLPQRVDMVLNAAAGSGKTTSLIILGETLMNLDPSRTAYYVTLNKKNADEVKAKFHEAYGGHNVIAKTMHALAYGKMMDLYPELMSKLRVEGALSTSELVDKFVHSIYGFYDPFDDNSGTHSFVYDGIVSGGESIMSSEKVYRIAIQMITNFCNSDDDRISVHHVPEYVYDVTTKWGKPVDTRKRLGKYVLPVAEMIWDDITSPDGVLPFTHDYYLKIWQLTDPVIGKPGDVIFYDEAQDAKPCVSTMVMRQDHAQRVFVGDNFQAIYRFSGSSDSLRKFSEVDGVVNLTLSKSFRFGQGVAQAANSMLRYMNAEPMNLDGAGAYDSKVYACTQGDLSLIPKVDAIITRSNADVVDAVMHLISNDISFSASLDFSLVRTVCADINTLSEMWSSEGLVKNNRVCMEDVEKRAQRLRSKIKIQELKEVDSLSELKMILEKEREEEAKILEYSSLYSVCLEKGTRAVLDAVNNSIPEEDAQIVVSTMHKAKGREWDNVMIWWDGSFFPRRTSDFTRNQYGDFFTPEKMDDTMLLYVAATRGRRSVYVPEVLVRITGMVVENPTEFEDQWLIPDLLDYVFYGGKTKIRRMGDVLLTPDNFEVVRKNLSGVLEPKVSDIVREWDKVQQSGDTVHGFEIFTVSEVVSQL